MTDIREFPATEHLMGTMSDLELVAGAESIPTKCLVAALSATWKMIDPLRPPGVEGSYARGRHNGIADALSQFCANLALELRRAPPQGEKHADR